MGVRIVTLDAGDHEHATQWDEYVAAHPHGTGYHGLGWKRVVERVYRYRTHCLYAEDGGVIAGVLPLAQVRAPFFGGRLVSVPFSTYGGILTDVPEALAALAEAAADLARRLRASSIEYRHVAPQLSEAATRSHKVTMWLDLPPSEDELWKAFPTELRTDIRRRLKAGLGTRIGGAEDLDDFYRVYTTNMRDLGTPTYPKRFFAAVLEEWPGAARIITCRFSGAAVAAGMLLGFGDTLEMPWASSLRAVRSLRPNMLLYWECLRYAIGAGFGRFDFGRSSPGSGTFIFKRQWGARAVPLHWQYWLADGQTEIPNLSPDNARFSAAIRVWQRLPVWVTRLVGSRLAACFP